MNLSIESVNEKLKLDFISKSVILTAGKELGILQQNNARALENASIINDDVFDSAFLTIMNGAMTVGSLIPLSEVEEASRENPQFGLILAISDFRIETSGITVSNKDAIVSGEYLELTFILVPKQGK